MGREKKVKGKKGKGEGIQVGGKIASWC